MKLFVRVNNFFVSMRNLSFIAFNWPFCIGPNVAFSLKRPCTHLPVKMPVVIEFSFTTRWRLNVRSLKANQFNILDTENWFVESRF